MNLQEAIEFTDGLRKQQYVTGKVTAIDSKYLVKEKQLYFSAQNISSDGKSIYRTNLVFEGVTSSENPDAAHSIPYSYKGVGVDLYLKTLTTTDRIRSRCQCQDYYFMWAFFNKREKSLVGPYKPYQRVSPPSGRPPVNPTESPGMCKHLLALTKYLMTNKVIKKDTEVWSYLNRPPRA